MRFSLIPREMKFFDLFDEFTAILTRASDKFLALVTRWESLPERTAELRQDEHACDRLVDRLIDALDRSFITPFDREDIHNLAEALDDVMDNLEETAYRLEAFRVSRPTPAALSMAEIIRGSCEHLEKAVRLCRDLTGNAGQIQTHLREISRLENEADVIYRDSERALFAQPPDVLELIKWRELYSWLEATVDAVRAASLIVSEVVVKGS
jgi:predicted phosphate transport protein (TIGR00153 family)